MSTKPEAGSPDELAWLRGFEEARNHFLAENARLREELEQNDSSNCNHENYLRKCIHFSEEEKQTFDIPYTHQVVFCLKCFQVFSQEKR